MTSIVRWLLWLMLVFSPMTALAQSYMTTVTAQVKDANGALYNSCRYSATLVNLSNSTLTLGATALPDQFKQVTGTQCDANGNLSTKLVANTALIPNNSQWRFTICDNNGANCFNFQTTISGTTIDITALVQSAAVVLPITNNTLLSGSFHYTGNNTFDILNGSQLRNRQWDADGDSITFGFGASVPANDYVNRVATARGYNVINHGVSGNTLFDEAKVAYGYNPTASSLMSLMIGTNDGGVEGTGDATPSTLWQNAYEAVAAYKLTPIKVKGQDAAATKVGSWVNSDLSPFGIETTTTGDTVSFYTMGTVAYIAIRGVLSNTSTISVTVDGSNKGTFTPSIHATVHSVSDAPYLVRITGLAYSRHQVVVTANIVGGLPLYFDWGAGNGGQSSSTGPFLFTMTPYETVGTPFNFVGYLRQEINQATSDLVGDGLQMAVVDVASACYDFNVTPPGLLCNGFDGTHPTDAGHLIIANTLTYAMDNFKYTFRDPISAQRLDLTSPGPIGGTTPSSVDATVFHMTLAGSGYQMPDSGGVQHNVLTTSADNNTYLRPAGSGGQVFVQDFGGANTFFGCISTSCTFTKNAAGNVSATFANFLPWTVGTTQLGSSTAPFAGVQIGTSSTNRSNITTTATAARAVSLPDAGGTLAIIPAATTTGRAACIKGTGQIGYCSTQPDATGACTCN